LAKIQFYSIQPNKIIDYYLLPPNKFTFSSHLPTTNLLISASETMHNEQCIMYNWFHDQNGALENP